MVESSQSRTPPLTCNVASSAAAPEFPYIIAELDTVMTPESRFIPPRTSMITPPSTARLPPSISNSSGYVLEDAFNVPVSVAVDSNVKEPPSEIVNLGLFVASDATLNTLRMMILQSSTLRSPVIVTFPSHVYVFVPPDAIEPS